MKIMLSSISQLELLINDIFDVYKLDIGRLKLIKKSVQVTNLVKDNIPGLELLKHKKKISFNVEVIPPPGIVSVLCDPRRIGQVITNLVKNSVDFVHDKGGKIMIRTERACTTQGNTGNPNYVTFTIEDNGALYFLKKLIIFSKSFTKKIRKHGGTGLGLVICKGIIEGHGGKIGVDANYTGGASIKFTLQVN